MSIFKPGDIIKIWNSFSTPFLLILKYKGVKTEPQIIEKINGFFRSYERKMVEVQVYTVYNFDVGEIQYYSYSKYSDPEIIPICELLEGLE